MEAQDTESYFRRLTIKKIHAAVAKNYKIDPEMITGKTRKKKAVIPRHTSLWLCHKLLGKGTPFIGYYTGHRHHTTVMYGIAMTEKRMKEDRNYRRRTERLERKLCLMK